MRVLFVTSESYPFATSGGLGDVSAALPKALRANKVAVRVVMPLYGDIPEQYKKEMKFIKSFNVPVAWRNQYCGLFELSFRGVKYYFLDNEQYFKRSGLYGHFDDGERFAFFSRAVLEMIDQIDFAPEVIHVNDWQSALVNVFINSFYRNRPKFYGIKTLLTIHNIQYQGKYDECVVPDILGLPEGDYGAVEYNGAANYLKGGIVSADRVNTVSPSYATEILDSWFAHGMDRILCENQGKLSGILNGIDYEIYDPATDEHIAANYTAGDTANKALCKQALKRRFSLIDDDAPVVGMVSRLVAHKGFDLVKHVLEYILMNGLRVVILGSGEAAYESCFGEFAARYPGQFGLHIGFSPKLAREVYAGADMFLMPSKSEPCGLAQMIALRYGTIPVVRETGGLRDTVFDSGDGAGNGFTFKSYNAHDMLDTLMRAKSVYEDKTAWRQLIDRAMACDMSWKKAARDYMELYKQMIALWE